MQNVCHHQIKKVIQQNMSVWFLFYGWEIHVTTSFDFSTQYYQPEALCILPAVLNVRKRVYFFTIMYPMTVVELICSGYRSTVFSEVQCLSSLCWRTTRWSNLSLRCRCQFYFPCIAVCKLLIYDLLSLFFTPSFYKKVVDFKPLYVGRVSFGSCFLWTIRAKLDFYQHQL